MIPNKKDLLGEKFSFGFYVTDTELILLDEGDMMTDILRWMEDIASKEGLVKNTRRGNGKRERDGPLPAGFLILLMDYLIRNDVLSCRSTRRSWRTWRMSCWITSRRISMRQ